MKLKTQGIMYTTIGAWYTFPCACNFDDADTHLAVRCHEMKDGVYPKPAAVTFKVDYIFEKRSLELEVSE